MSQDILLSRGLGPLFPEQTERGYALPWICTDGVPGMDGIQQATADVLDTILAPYGIRAEWEQNPHRAGISRIVLVLPPPLTDAEAVLAVLFAGGNESDLNDDQKDLLRRVRAAAVQQP